MATKKYEINDSYDYEFEIDEEIFAETLKDFREYMDHDATEESVMEYVAGCLTLNMGYGDMLDGVGFIAAKGCPKDDPQRQPFSGITLISGSRL